MNIKKSIRVALAQREKNAVWLAEEIGVTRQQITNICSNKQVNSKTIEKLAKAFEIKESELISLGE